MTSRGTVYLIATIGGVSLTVVFAIAGSFLDRIGAHSLANLVFWLGLITQIGVHCVKGSQAGPAFCEGTPITVLATIAGLALSIFVYTTIIYIVLRRWAQRD